MPVDGVPDSFLKCPSQKKRKGKEKKISSLLNSNKISITIRKSVTSPFSDAHFLS